MMDFEAIARIWREQDVGSLINNEAELLQQLQHDYQFRSRKLTWLNVREGVPCLVLSALTLAVGLNIQSGAWAFLTAAGLLLVVAVFLVAVTIGYQVSQPPFSETVRQSLQRSLAQARHREWLYRNIAWWYLLPIVVAWGAIVYEKMLRNGMSVLAALYVAFGLAFFLFVGWLNRRIAVKHYRPLCERLELMLKQLTEEGPA